MVIAYLHGFASGTGSTKGQFFRARAALGIELRDTVVDPELSEVFARGRQHVERELLDSDHELRDVLEPMWERMRTFLRLPGDI